MKTKLIKRERIHRVDIDEELSCKLLYFTKQEELTVPEALLLIINLFFDYEEMKRNTNPEGYKKESE